MALKVSDAGQLYIRPGAIIDLLQHFDGRFVAEARKCGFMQRRREAYYQGRAAMCRELEAAIIDLIVDYEGQD